MAALLASAVPAVADSVPNKARKLADRGRAAHDARDYAGAIVAFTEAYALSPAPGLLFNLAQAYRLRGNCDDASLMYRRYLATGPADDARVLAEMHLATVERCLAKKVDVVANAKLSAPEVRMPRAPAPDPRFKKDGPPAKDSRALGKFGVGLAVGGGAALLVAGYYGFESHQASSEVERRYAAGEKWRALEARAAEGETAANRATIAAGVGAAAVIAGAAVLVIDHRRSKKVLRIEPVAGGARVGVTWRF
jgi:tetratricopeptide (TPR) repeat protein